MSSLREQALIDAPVEWVWALVGDPNRYPEWASEVVDVTGLAEVDEGATFSQRSRTPLGQRTTTFVIDELDDLREIHLRCLSSGYYAHWRLTEARDATFAEVEVGMEPSNLTARAMDTVLGARWYRRIVHQALDSLRALASGARPAAQAPAVDSARGEPAADSGP